MLAHIPAVLISPAWAGLAGQRHKQAKDAEGVHLTQTCMHWKDAEGVHITQTCMHRIGHKSGNDTHQVVRPTHTHTHTHTYNTHTQTHTHTHTYTHTHQKQEWHPQSIPQQNRCRTISNAPTTKAHTKDTNHSAANWKPQDPARTHLQLATTSAQICCI